MQKDVTFKHIGNITYKHTDQTHPDPKKEQMRAKLIQDKRLSWINKKAKRHLDEMGGQKDYFESIRFFCGKDGRLPKNLHIDDIEKIYKTLYGQLVWTRSLMHELDRVAQELCPERYEKETQEEEEKDRIERERRQEALNEINGERKSVLKPVVADLVRNVISKQVVRRSLRIKAAKKSLESEILPVRQIEQSLRFLFADYIKNPIYKVSNEPEARYDRIVSEFRSLRAAEAELTYGLEAVSELLESIHVFLEANSQYS